MQDLARIVGDGNPKDETNSITVGSCLVMYLRTSLGGALEPSIAGQKGQLCKSPINESFEILF